MDRDFLYRLLVYISAFGVSDNILNHYKVDTQKRIIIYTLLFAFTYMFLRPSAHPIDPSSSEKNI